MMTPIIYCDTFWEYNLGISPTYVEEVADKTERRPK